MAHPQPLGGPVTRARLLLERAERTPTAAPRSREWTGKTALLRLRSFSPNRVAVLGENVILLVNRPGPRCSTRCFLRRRGAFSDLERFQTNYLPVYFAWVVIVVVVFPPLFGYS